MTKTLRLRLLFIVALLLLCVVGAEAQHRSGTRRTGVVNPNSRDHSGYILYYEFEQVDVQPEFPGGEHGLVNFINDTREYPYREYVNHIQGRVLCSFIITAEGHVTRAQVMRSSGNVNFDEEALRVINKMPRWEAGRINNNRVNVRCILPIAFRL